MKHLLAVLLALASSIAAAQGPVFNVPPSAGCVAGRPCTGTTITATTRVDIGGAATVGNLPPINSKGVSDTTAYITARLASSAGQGSFINFTDTSTYNTGFGTNTDGSWSWRSGNQPGVIGTELMKLSMTAGQGLLITSATATTDVAALSVTRTNNNAAVATGVKFAFTDTTSAAGFLPFQVLGGAAATTNLLSASKTGGLTTGTPNGGTAAAWKFGVLVNAACVLDAANYIQIDVAGTLYKMAICQ